MLAVSGALEVAFDPLSGLARQPERTSQRKASSWKEWVSVVDSGVVIKPAVPGLRKPAKMREEFEGI